MSMSFHGGNIEVEGWSYFGKWFCSRLRRWKGNPSTWRRRQEGKNFLYEGGYQSKGRDNLSLEEGKRQWELPSGVTKNVVLCWSEDHNINTRVVEQGMLGGFGATN
jgi:hypothetical protein